MSVNLPHYLSISPDKLGEATRVKVRVVGDMANVARHMADAMLRVLREKRSATLIVPVGPIDQYPLLAQRINEERLDCREAVFINMDEYLTEDDRWVDEDHPLSFRGLMRRRFSDLVEERRAPQVVFPDPREPEKIAEIIAGRGGVDVCFGGIGINGHVAFNEPEETSIEEFVARQTRILDLTAETRTINSVTVGGEIGIVPRRAITVGMKEILASKQLRFYCNRPWQRAVVRRVLHGPITATCPASLLRTHADAELTIADYVAALPEIQLR